MLRNKLGVLSHHFCISYISVFCLNSLRRFSIISPLILKELPLFVAHLFQLNSILHLSLSLFFFFIGVSRVLFWEISRTEDPERL